MPFKFPSRLVFESCQENRDEPLLEGRKSFNNHSLKTFRDHRFFSSSKGDEKGILGAPNDISGHFRTYSLISTRWASLFNSRKTPLENLSHASRGSKCLTGMSPLWRSDVRRNFLYVAEVYLTSQQICSLALLVACALP